MKNLIYLFFIMLFTASAAHAQSKDLVMERLQNWRADISMDGSIDDLEKDLRKSFLNRLIFHTERNYQGGDDQYRTFMIQTLKTFNKVDQLATNRSLNNDQYFSENLLLSLQEVLEPTEDLISFMKSYMEYSGLSEPSSSEDFGASRSYINGDQLAFAAPMELEEASDLLTQKEKREQENLEQIPFKLSNEEYSLQYQNDQELIPKDLMFENSLIP